MAGVSTLPLGRPLTLEDFEALRDGVDDGARYELVDGSLVVTPAPTWAHQVVLTALLRELLVSNPDEGRYVILAAPHDVHLGGTSVLQPDLSVHDLERGGRDLPAHVVEILSPSTRHLDLGLKRSRYAAGGIEHYWVVDPGDVSVTAWQLRDGAYVGSLVVAGDQTATLPGVWPVTLRPSDLVRHA